MKPLFQIWLRAALALLLAFAGLFGEPVHTARAYALNPAATEGSTITYDDEGNVAYDGSHRFPFGYDGGAKPPENKYGDQLSGYRAPFGIFSDFLAAESGVLNGANYAQRTFSSTFSSGGTFAGQTVEDVAAALRSGTLSPADVPIQYIVQDGNTLMLNTRSAQALEQAGIPRSAWNAVDMSGDAAAQARLAAQLQRNGLGSQGIPTVTPGH